MNPSESGLKVTDPVLDPAADYYIGYIKAPGSTIKTVLNI
jgi:hypothetical protein